MRVTSLCVALTLVPNLLLAQVRVGPTIGASLLEHHDTSLTHGPLVDDVTVGRTAVAGAIVDVSFTAHDHLTFEVVVGPYHNDVERSCINRAGEPACTPEPFKSVSRGILYGMQYLRTFGRHAWMPVVGGGIGVKTYTYESDFEAGNASPTISGTFGVERERGFPARLEVRALFVRDNPLLFGKTQFEMQARATFLFPPRK